MKVVVTGIGLVTSLGNLDQSWESLLSATTAIKQHQPFSNLPPLPLAMVEDTPVRVESLTQKALTAALTDAGLFPPLPDSGVVIGSSRSCQATWEHLAQGEGEISNWLATLPNQPGAIAARLVGATGPLLTPMAACATGIWAIAQGYELIKYGYCQRVIVGATEAPITPLTLIGFSKMGALATTGCYPFDRHRQGLVLGEGAAIFVLESEELACDRQAHIYGQLLGFGFTSDAYHISAPESIGKTAITAIKKCLASSNLSSQQIDYIHAHGTSTKLNDSREAKLIEYLFPKVAVSSTKGATGHTLGASGALGAAFCLMAIKQQKIPPCVGLKQTEFNLNLVKETKQATIKNTLCFSFGFGGQNAVMAIGKREKGKGKREKGVRG